MAITITSEPTLNHKSVYSDFQYQVTSDRDDLTVYAVTAVQNDGGYLQLTLETGHTIQTSDVTLLSGFSAIPNTYYNITALSGLLATTDLTWSTAYSGDTGNAQKNNRSFRILARVFQYSVTPTNLIGRTFNFGSGGTYSFILNDLLSTLVIYQHQDYGALQSFSNPVAASTYIVQFVEQYDDASGLRISVDTVNSSLSLIDNITRQHWEDQTLDAYMTELSSTQLALTNRTDGYSFDTAIPLYNEEHYITEYLWKTGTQARAIAYYYDVDKVVIGAAVLNSLYNTTFKRLQIRATNDATARASASRYYIAVLLANTSSLAIAKPRFFRIVREDIKDCSTRIEFVNRLGAFDYYTFKGFSDSSDTAERIQYVNDKGIGFAVSDRGRTNLQVIAGREFTCHSEFLSDSEALWLGELLTTQAAWVVNSSQQSLPIDILHTSQFVQNSEGIQLQIKYRYSNNLIIQ